MANPFKIGQVVQMAFPPHELQVIVATPFDDRVDIRPLHGKGRIGVPITWVQPTATPHVHAEPDDLRTSPAEHCVDCHQLTRFWIDSQTPLCEDCCAKRVAKS